MIVEARRQNELLATALPKLRSALVADLVDHELVRETAEAPKALPVLNGERGAYVSPGVDKYTDMQELILLDPVHEVDAIGWPAPAKTSET